MAPFAAVHFLYALPVVKAVKFGGKVAKLVASGYHEKNTRFLRTHTSRAPIIRPVDPDHGLSRMISYQTLLRHAYLFREVSKRDSTRLDPQEYIAMITLCRVEDLQKNGNYKKSANSSAAQSAGNSSASCMAPKIAVEMTKSMFFDIREMKGLVIMHAQNMD